MVTVTSFVMSGISGNLGNSGGLMMAIGSSVTSTLGIGNGRFRSTLTERFDCTDLTGINRNMIIRFQDLSFYFIHRECCQIDCENFKGKSDVVCFRDQP